MNENTQQPAATAHSEESRQWEECVAKFSLDEGTSNKVRHLIEQIEKGEVDETTVSILSHAVNHDEELKNAETEGYLRGRNEKNRQCHTPHSHRGARPRTRHLSALQ